MFSSTVMLWVRVTWYTCRAHSYFDDQNISSSFLHFVYSRLHSNMDYLHTGHISICQPVKRIALRCSTLFT